MLYLVLPPRPVALLPLNTPAIRFYKVPMGKRFWHLDEDGNWHLYARVHRQMSRGNWVNALLMENPFGGELFNVTEPVYPHISSEAT